jgi:hypothetical protein
MGAVFLLICLPITAALGFILGTTHSEASIGALMAGGMFLLLCGVIAVGAFRMARGWDEEQGGH